MSNLDLIDAAIQIWGSIILIIFMICMLLQGRKKEKIDRLYLIMAVFAIAAMLLDVIATVFGGRYFIARTAEGIKYLSFVCTDIWIYHITLFVWEEFRLMNVRKSFIAEQFTIKLFLLFSILCLTVNTFYPFLFRYDVDSSGFVRQQLFPIVHACYGSMLGICLLGGFRIRRELDNKTKIAIFAYVMLAMLVVLVPRSVNQFKFDQLGLGLVMVILYLRLQMNYDPDHESQKRELAQEKAAMLLNQIQPALLFESLDAIQQLSKTDPKKAGEAISHFATFLRENMDNLTRKELIPIDMEIKHVNDYLYIEKLRIPEVSVSFDLKAEPFLIPPHTIQPLIENMIRNDFNGRKSGEILVSSYNEGDVSVVVISGNGTGNCLYMSNLSPEDQRRMDDIQLRIRQMCDGKLYGRSDDSGTRAFLELKQPVQ